MVTADAPVLGVPALRNDGSTAGPVPPRCWATVWDEHGVPAECYRPVAEDAPALLCPAHRREVIGG